MNAPALPSATQYAELRSTQELGTRSQAHDVTIDDGTLTIGYDQPLPGITLVLLTKRPDIGPRQVEGVHLEHYQGMTGAEEVLILWDGIDSRALRTYEVYFARHIDGPYARINAADQLDTAFLHVREPGAGVYAVRAVDYWNRYGDFSERASG
jgi:hypothetical protein